MRPLRFVALFFLLLLTPVVSSCRDSRNCVGRRRGSNRRTDRATSEQGGIVQVRRPGGFRHRRPHAVRAGGTDGQPLRPLQIRDRHSGWRQSLRVRTAAGLHEEVRGAVQEAPRRRSEVLRLPREPRRARAAFLQAVQHGRQFLLHVQPEGRGPVLCAGKHLSGAGAGSVAREGTEVIGQPLENRRSSTTLCIRPANAMGRTPSYARCSSRCS